MVDMSGEVRPITLFHHDKEFDGASSTATVARGSKPVYVTDLGPNDILLGRGAPIINYEGNVRFRELVSERKAEYIGTGRHQIKDDIAKQIIEVISQRKGRFLRKVDTLSNSHAQLDVPEGSKVYQIAELDTSLEKVKQALRDRDPAELVTAALAARKCVVSSESSSAHDYKLSQCPSVGLAHAASNLQLMGVNSSLNMLRYEQLANLPGANSDFLASSWHRQMSDELALLHQRRVQQQYLDLLQHQHSSSVPLSIYDVSPEMRSHNQLSADDWLELRRHQIEALVSSSRDGGPALQNTAFGRSHSVGDLQLAAMMGLREQQLLDRRGGNEPDAADAEKFRRDRHQLFSLFQAQQALGFPRSRSSSSMLVGGRAAPTDVLAAIFPTALGASTRHSPSRNYSAADHKRRSIDDSDAAPSKDSPKRLRNYGRRVHA